MIPFYTDINATQADAPPQRSPEDSIGGFRSGTPFRSMEWDASDPLVGVSITDVSGGNGQGIGTLTAATADSLTWTPPNGTAGAAVALEVVEEAVIRGGDPGSWVRVARRGVSPLSGAKAVRCIDRYNNLFPDVETDDAVAGLVTDRALMLQNDLGAMTDFLAWVGSGDIEIALEEPTAGELLGTGLFYNGATVEGDGPGLGTVDDYLGIWIRRTIAADTAPSASTTWEVRYSFTVGAIDYTGSLRGRYRVERTDYIKEGIWIGLGAYPDFDAAPDETWTSRPHTTSLGLTLPATVFAGHRAMNKWGLWGAHTDVVKYDIDAGGDSTRLAPSAPTEVSIGQTSANLPTIGALYDAAADSDDAAALWVIWLETDGTSPDGSATPAGYQVMQSTAAFDDLAWTSEDAALIDGTPVNALVRTRRLDSAGGTAFSPDVIQLTDSGAGTLKVDDVISDWPATGYASITTRFGKLLEVIHYSGISDSGGQTTVTVDERGLWGTTGVATSSSMIITPVVAVDSENTDVVSYEMITVAPGRPGGAMIYGTQGAQAQNPLTAPDGSTPIVLNIDENVYLLLGEGTASFYVDTQLIWRVLFNGDHGEINGFYIPSEFAMVNEEISGAASGSGVVDAVDADTIYVCVSGQRRMLINLAAMEIRVAWLGDDVPIDVRAEQSSTLERFGATMFMCWDPEREDYRPYLEIDSAGFLATAMPIQQELNAADVEAIWQV